MAECAIVQLSALYTASPALSFEKRELNHLVTADCPGKNGAPAERPLWTTNGTSEQCRLYAHVDQGSQARYSFLIRLFSKAPIRWEFGRSLNYPRRLSDFDSLPGPL